jgi:hypothetical protein
MVGNGNALKTLKLAKLKKKSTKVYNWRRYAAAPNSPLKILAV